jgi:acyl-CoA synthetase (AMP-forming)/AMP-acid ligase II/thioesterase domain-containing protein/aryl carrier-like protein
MSDSIGELLDRQASAAPEADALLSLDRRPLRYRELRELVSGVGGELRGLGVGRSDRVALVLPNGPEAATAFLSVAAAAVCAPLNPAYREAELDFYLGDLEPKALVVAPDTDSPAAEVASRLGIEVLELRRAGDAAGCFSLGAAASDPGPPARPEDVALVLHTSGTTSRPKLVPLAHANLCASAASVASALRLGPGDRCLNLMPLFHIHGLVAALLASLHAGASVVCTPGLHAPSFLGWLEQLEPTWYTAVPTMHQAIVARAGGQEVRSRLRVVRSSSAPLPRRVAEELEATFGVPVIEAYGMTEAAHQIASNPLPPGERRPGSVGTAAGPELAILDASGRQLPARAIGEVAIRGSSVFSGYESNPEANALAFADGWFRTGDEGYLDDDGYLFLRGRLKEIINRGGEKVAPGEIEEALLAHPAVAQAVAFAVPDARLGEEVGAAVVLRDGALEPGVQELQAFVGERLADFKVPRTVAVVEEIPKGATGKLQRLGLAERLGIGGGRPEAAPFVAPRTATERQLAELWRELLGVGEIGVDDDFFALGGDSILAAELVARLREEGARSLSLTTLVWAPTIAALAAELGHGAKGSGSPSALVTIQRGGERPPLFFVHALDGEAARFGALARSLGADQPLYALREPGVDEQRPRHSSVEAMAESYLAEVRAVQRQGPYFLGAVCMGAAIAIEMARALIAQGEDVGPLALVDPRVPRSPARAAKVRRAALGVRSRLARLDPWRRPRPYVDDPARPYLKEMSTIRNAYTMAPYPAGAVLYLSDDRRSLDWLAAVRGPVEIHKLGGTHMGLLRHPTVAELARLIEADMEQA